MAPSPLIEIHRLSDYAVGASDGPPDPDFMAPAEASWFCATALVPMGWCLTTPMQAEPDGLWIAIAYNTEGCLFDITHAEGMGPTPQAAVVRVGCAIESLLDSGLFVDRRRSPH